MKKIDSSKPRRLKFVAYAYSEAIRKKSMGSLGVANNYTCATLRFVSFLATHGKKDISFKKITALLMSDFESWLLPRCLCIVV